MKAINLSLFIIVVILSFKCTYDRPNLQGSKDEGYIILNNYIINDTIEKILNNYINYVDDSTLIFQVFIEQQPDSTTIFVAYSQFIEEINRYLPTGYFKIRGNLILVYSGIDNLIKVNPEIKKQINKECLEKNLISIDSKFMKLTDKAFCEIVISRSGKVIRKNGVRDHRYGLPLPPFQN